MSQFRLEELGWKAFQDLCGTIGREVMGQTLQVFSQGADAGRDGAFGCTWNPEPGMDLAGETVIQCKHFSSAAASLVPSTITDELEKIRALVVAGRCDNYVLMSNGKLSAPTEASIRDLVRAKGVKKCLVYGREWIEAIISENRQLRSLVPRVYGLGDLTQIIDQRAYDQASKLLESLKYDIETFVPTDSYRQAAKTLAEHNLVLLLGEPAAGKSVIASTLALAATDQWKCWTVKAETADQFVAHWNPSEPNQFFWIDDAFGPTQFLEELASSWNAVLPKMRAAATHGARIVITSRDYIWNAARRQLKLSAWPELESGKVVVNIERISSAEREAILYNHMRLGAQPRVFRTSIKPYLSTVANHERFLPELARRLANPAFTQDLSLDSKHLDAFVERPEQFLLDVVRNLDPPSRAALTLLVMSSGDLQSPLSLDASQKRALQMMGADEASVREAFTALDGSVVKLSIAADGSRAWVARHPTITDAVTSLMREEPELLEIYLRMAKIGRLVREVDCGSPRERSVSVPPGMYPLIGERLAELNIRSHDELMYLTNFLGRRCGEPFLRHYFEQHPEIVERLLEPAPNIEDADEIGLLSKLKNLDLLTDDHLNQLAEHAQLLAVSVPDPSFETSNEVRALLGSDRIEKIRIAVAEELPRQFSSVLSDWNSNYDANYEPSDYLGPLREAVEALGMTSLEEQISDLEWELDQAYSERGDYEDAHADEWREDARISEAISERSIFDDVDR